MATKTVLKGHFNTGDTPTEAQFASLIDSYPSFDDDFAPKYVKVEVSSAEILALNTTPKELVAAPGAGKVIVPMSMISYYKYGSTAYLTNLNLGIIHQGSSSDMLSISNALAGSVDLINGVSLSSVAEAIEVINTALNVRVRTGDPTAGDGTLDIHLWYSEVTL